MPDFGFERWPFEISSGAASSVQWAGRPELREMLDKQIVGLRPDRPTSLTNLWAAYGAGKTFAMRYLEKAALKKGAFVTYCVTPGGAASFGSFYKLIIDSLDSRAWRVLEDSLMEVKSDVAQSIYRAIRKITIGNMTQAAEAQSYLSGAKTSVRQRRELDVTADFSDVNRATSALATILTILGKASGVLVLLDEFQDLANFKDKSRIETLQCFQKLFDEVPLGLRMVTSFTLYNKETIDDILGPALSSRSTRILEVPEFSAGQAVSFLSALILQAKPAESSNSLYPFSQASLEQIVAASISAGDRLLPRALIQRAHRELEDYE
jgi:hypothetical protein